MFLNLRKGKLSVNTYRFINAVSDSVENVLDSVDTNKIMTAVIKTEEDWQAVKFLTKKAV